MAQKITVRRVEKNNENIKNPSSKPQIKIKSKDMFFPICGGIMLDFLDLTTFGPIGIYAGFLLGFIIGYQLCPIFGLHNGKKRLVWACVTGIYFTIPGTEYLPIATIGILLLTRAQNNARR